jgi:hypothetical protein
MTAHAGRTEGGPQDCILAPAVAWLDLPALAQVPSAAEHSRSVSSAIMSLPAHKGSDAAYRVHSPRPQSNGTICPFPAIAARPGQRPRPGQKGTKSWGLPPEKRTSRRTCRSLEPNRAGQRPLGCKPALPAS